MRGNSSIFGARQGCRFLVVFTLALSGGLYYFAPDILTAKICQDCVNWYIPVAEGLAAGHGFVHPGDSAGGIAVVRPPGNSVNIFLMLKVSSVFGVERELIYWAVNTIFICIAAVLLFLVTFHLWGETQSALAVSVVWVTFPLLLWFLNQPYSEVPFIVCLHAAGYFFLAKLRVMRRLTLGLVVGGLLGCAALYRPIVIGLPIVIGILSIGFGLLDRSVWRGVRLAIGLMIGAYSVIGVWSVFVWVESGEKILITDGTLFSNSMKDGVTFGVDMRGYREGVRYPKLSPEIIAFMEKMQGHFGENQVGQEIDSPSANRSPPDLTSADILREIYQELSHEPLLAAKVLMLKGARAWFGTDSNKHETQALAIMSGYGILILAAILRGLATRVIMWRLLLIVSVITGYFWLLSILVLPIVRYLVPITGLLFILLPGLWVRQVTPQQLSLSQREV
jgi:hypothetical protein